MILVLHRNCPMWIIDEADTETSIAYESNRKPLSHLCKVIR